jgi:hypothetical protein
MRDVYRFNVQYEGLDDNWIVVDSCKTQEEAIEKAKKQCGEIQQDVYVTEDVCVVSFKTTIKAKVLN